MYIYLDENNKVIGYGGGKGESSIFSESVPEDFLENFYCYQYKDGEFILNQELLNNTKIAQQAQAEYNELLQWFTWYDNQCAQYARAQRLGIEFDRDIVELDQQANKNQNRISELRKLL